MKCIICDRCKKIIENPRHARVLTCARPFKIHTEPCSNKPVYHGNDPRMNDILWDKELCDACLDDLETFLGEGPGHSQLPEEDEAPTEEVDSEVP